MQHIWLLVQGGRCHGWREAGFFYVMNLIVVCFLLSEPLSLQWTRKITGHLSHSYFEYRKRNLCTWIVWMFSVCEVNLTTLFFLMKHILSRRRGLAPLVMYGGLPECYFAFRRPSQVHTDVNLCNVCLCWKASLCDGGCNQIILNDRSRTHLVLRHLFEILVIAFCTVFLKFNRFNSRVA